MVSVKEVVAVFGQRDWAQGHWAGGAEVVPPGWGRPAPNAVQLRNDVILAVVFAIGAVAVDVLTLSIGEEMTGSRPPFAEELAWCLAVSLPLAFRRRYPLGVLLVCSLAFFGLQFREVGEHVISQISLFLALFTAGAWTRERTVGRAVRGLVVALMFCWLGYALSIATWDEIRQDAPEGPLPAVLAVVLLTGGVNILYFGAAWAFGDTAWRSAGQRALLEQRNAELARERDENARRAVLDERVRIARELHDVVAHHVSVMGVQAGAARMVLATDPDAARTALAEIEQASRDAVGEMRRLLGVLRSVPVPGQSAADPSSGSAETAPPDSPSPGVDRVGDLVAAAQAAGLRASCTVVGTPVQLSPSLSVSAYRIVQEALTNTVRHAAASRVDVRLRYLVEPAAAPAFEVEVVDDGRADPAEHGGPACGGTARGSGLGLVGMRERAGLHDAEIEVGPRPGGGFRVRVRFPLPAGAAHFPVTPGCDELGAAS